MKFLKLCFSCPSKINVARLFGKLKMKSVFYAKICVYRHVFMEKVLFAIKMRFVLGLKCGLLRDLQNDFTKSLDGGLRRMQSFTLF